MIEDDCDFSDPFCCFNCFQDFVENSSDEEFAKLFDSFDIEKNIFYLIFYRVGKFYKLREFL